MPPAKNKKEQPKRAGKTGIRVERMNKKNYVIYMAEKLEAYQKLLKVIPTLSGKDTKQSNDTAKNIQKSIKFDLDRLADYFKSINTKKTE